MPKNHSKITIGVDASRSNVKQMTGTEYYSYEIISRMVKSSAYYFRLYCKTPLQYISKQDNIEQKVMRFPKLWSQIRLSWEIFRNPPSVLFEPAHTIPIFHGKKTVVTLHDVGFKYFPELYTPLERFYHNFSMSFSVKHATKIIAISENTKSDLVKLYHADPKKITVIYHGYDKLKYKPLSKEDRVPEEIKRLEKYIYFIGRLEAKKNIVNLIKAYGELRKNPKIKHKLVLGGRPGYEFEKISEEIESLPANIRKDVVLPGYIKDDHAPLYLKCCDLFAWPTYFEGFGMPLVEAMACHIPIVASNTTSTPEVLGDAGLMCDPNDFKLFASNMEKVITDTKLRESLVKKGEMRIPMFNWDDSVQKTLDVICDAAYSDETNNN